ncbi:MAG: hypothetical protein ACK4Q5_21780, partial [Saprospiraceae bacterium]
VLAGVPADENVNCQSIPPAATVLATDNCDASVQVVFSENITPGACADDYLVVRVWTATDACGNAATASQTITVTDDEAPILAGIPADVAGDCDQIPVVPPAGSVTATDNCDVDVNIVFNETEVAGACLGSKVVTRTWVATDNCGNQTVESQVISVGDAQPPVLAGVPADENVNCQSIPPAATVLAT